MTIFLQTQNRRRLVIDQVIEALSPIPAWMARGFRGELTLPRYTVDTSIDWRFGCPPCLLPLMSSGSGPFYIGMIDHLFGSRRRCFVKYYVETGEFYEIGKTPEQLATWLSLEFLCEVPSIDEVGVFAEEVDLCKAKDITEYFKGFTCTDDLVTHPTFQGALPGELANGGGPYVAFDTTDQGVKEVTNFEIPSDSTSGTEMPDWFKHSNLPALFAQLLESDDLVGAWFCLNSRGWSVSEAQRAFSELAECSGRDDVRIRRDWYVDNSIGTSSY